METVLFGGGCFWCTDSVFRKIKGVESVVSGYAGGETESPSYEQICTGTTGHAEVVQVSFNPEVVSYTDLLNVFFATHDPTTLNQQGADTGTQYRSVIFFTSDTQRELTEEVMHELESDGTFEDPIVTEVTPAPVFYPAEEYHQDFYTKNPSQGYCVASIEPKFAKLRKRYSALLVE